MILWISFLGLRMTKKACAQVCKVTHRYYKLRRNLTNHRAVGSWWERSRSVRQTVAWYPGNTNRKGSTGTERPRCYRMLSSGTPCFKKDSYHGFIPRLRHSLYSHIACMHVHINTPEHVWWHMHTCEPRLTQICTFPILPETPRVRCLIENKHCRPFNWQIQIYLGQQLFEQRQL